MIFLDTSAIYALADAGDLHHKDAVERFGGIVTNGERLITHSYVVLESIALLQARLGLPQALKFARDSVAFEIEWVSRELHESGVRGLGKSGKRNVSLVDHISFVIMTRRNITTAFAYDSHFKKAGFQLLEG